MQRKRVRENAPRAVPFPVGRQEAAICSEGGSLGDSEEPPGSQPSLTPRHPRWSDVPLSHWEDWRWQMQNAVRTTRQLAELLPLPSERLPDLERLESQYKLVIPPYYLSLIQDGDPYQDPIGLQALPHVAEIAGDSVLALDDPLEEDKDSPVAGLTHRYPDRVLLITTPVCSMYCRFCTRKRVTMDRDGWDVPTRDELRMIDYVASHREIHDCILSGGDALMLSEKKLRWFLTQLAAIRHVDVIRIGTRAPVTLPQKLFDDRLIDVLRETGKVWIQTHFNHPREITFEAARACRNLVEAGLPINNHTVLLAGVNDSVETMRDLMRGLLRIRVRPYYLFHCDPVTGAGHFRTSVWKGLEIMEGLRGHISGLGVPTYVIDGLHGAGKIPLMPNYLVSASDQAVVLRNYEGMLFRYAPEDHHPRRQPPFSTTGVSNLLSGDGEKLVPQDNPRMARRRAHAIQTELAVEASVVIQGSVRGGASAAAIAEILEPARRGQQPAARRARVSKPAATGDTPSPTITASSAKAKRVAPPKPKARSTRRPATPVAVESGEALVTSWASAPADPLVRVLDSAEK
jgi:lysine 2,3-aminomutase